MPACIRSPQWPLLLPAALSDLLPLVAQAAQALVQEALSKPTNDRDFEASSYQAQARAQIAAEKVRTVEGYLLEMKRVSLLGENSDL